MTNAQRPSQQLPAPIVGSQNATSRRIPLEWVERIFSKMASTFGVKFADAWRGCDMEIVKADWAEVLSEYSVAEIRAGIAGLRTLNWPPMQPEFLKLCRPPIDPEAAHIEAVREYRNRFENGSDTWSRPEIFWAAQAIGHFKLMSVPYPVLKARWLDALARAKNDPVPQRLIELPARGEVTADPAKVKQIFAELDARLAARAKADRSVFEARPTVKPYTQDYYDALADVERREAQSAAQEEAKGATRQ